MLADMNISQLEKPLVQLATSINDLKVTENSVDCFDGIIVGEFQYSLISLNVNECFSDGFLRKIRFKEKFSEKSASSSRHTI